MIVNNHGPWVDIAHVQLRGRKKERKKTIFSASSEPRILLGDLLGFIDDENCAKFSKLTSCHRRGRKLGLKLTMLRNDIAMLWNDQLGKLDNLHSFCSSCR